MDYTPQELMVVSAARAIQDNEIVFVGMRLPLLAFGLAKETHAPSAVGLFENGLVRDRPSPELLYTMSDSPNVAGALWCTRMVNVMGFLARGEVDLGFIGGAEIDRYSNLNTSYIGGPEHVQVKLPGSGGAADIACLARRLIIIMAHEKRRFVLQVGYVTSPGHGEGQGWRERVGLPGGGPTAVITTLGVLTAEPDSRELMLHSYHPFTTPEDVRASTGWDLRLSPNLHETPPPSPEELAIIRRYDPQGFWTRET